MSEMWHDFARISAEPLNHPKPHRRQYSLLAPFPTDGYSNNNPTDASRLYVLCLSVT
ncbi:MAG: hypothetical protein AAFQ41_11830 [Cyanobacteria bacterium J06623_7]